MAEVTPEVMRGTTDARVWAEEFVRMVRADPGAATDLWTVAGWFGIAIEAGGRAAEQRTLRELLAVAEAAEQRVRRSRRSDV